MAVGRFAVLCAGSALMLTGCGAPSSTAAPTATSPPPPGSAQPTASQLTPSPTLLQLTPSPATWSGAARPDAAVMPVLTMAGPGLCVADGPIRWEDGLDAQAGFVDIIETAGSRSPTRSLPLLKLASKPPIASQLDPRDDLIEYGLVFDMDNDGTPDNEVGINNSPGSGEYRVWVTDLDRGETVEQVGRPYGMPVDFMHPDESGGPTMSFWFLNGAPSFLGGRSDGRYYAWSSHSKNGSVVAWDYAPNFGWLEPPDCESVPAKGWPSTVKNAPGLYSWDGGSCAADSCIIGFMHNGYGSGDVEIRIDVVSEGTDSDSTYRTEVAGHDAIYRRIDARREEWIVEIDATTIAIRLKTRPGTSKADLADAHAIIESMLYERQDFRLGFRLIFTLTTDDWDSG